MGFADRVVDYLFRLIHPNKSPQLQDPHRFDTGGLQFDYPRNWKITEEEDERFEDGGMYSVDMETAMGGVVSITVMVPNDGVDLATYAEGAVAGFQEAVGGAFRLGRFSPIQSGSWKVEPTRQLLANQDRDGIRIEVDTKCFGETITSRFEIHHVDAAGYSMFVMTNATEAEQWGVELPGFELLWRSVRFAIRPGAG